MRLVAAHARAGILELARHPGFAVATLLFPSVFFVFFVSTRVDGREASELFLAGYVGFALLGVAFFQFGAGIAAERAWPWEAYLRTLPVAPSTRFAARVLTALAFGLSASVLVAATAAVTTEASPAVGTWALLTISALLGSVPFALLGLALGYWATPKGALPLANLLFLTLSFAGGLWTTAGNLPEAVSELSFLVPTRPYAEVLWGAVERDPVRPDAWAALAGYGVLFGAFALWGYRRDEGERFG